MAVRPALRLVLVLMFVALMPTLWAQSPAGTIRLEVEDTSRAALQVSGRLHNVATGSDRAFRTDAQGRVSFAGLPYGRYRVEVSRGGFATQTVVLDVESAAPVDRTVTMILGVAISHVDVLATTPLAGSSLPVEEIPSPVQTVTQAEIEASGSLDLSDLLNRRLSGVNINENQENPFQPDVNYRGYTASPLLGTPQGISVYVDGVRQNQPFGDVVSWDLIPRIAIAEVALVPGSNPLYGLNTLGGAISVETKDGRSQPGTTVTASGGSYGRRAVEFEHGGSLARGLSWYGAGNIFHEDGWRIDSPSNVRQAFGKLGWQGAKSSASLAVSYADNKLTGNGLQEQRFLARNYASGYTLGDTQTDRSPFANLTVHHALTDSLSLSGNAYFRYVRVDTVNPNLNTNSITESVYQPSAADQAALKAAGYTGYPTSGANASNTPFPYWRCIAQALQQSEPVEKCDAVIVLSATKQSNYGLSAQMAWDTAAGGHRNQLIAGGAWDHSGVHFVQNTQYGYINPDYTVTPINAFEDGTNNSNGTPVDSRVDLHGQPQTWSLYATDTRAFGRRWGVTVSGRYNRTSIDNRDRINPGGGPGSLDGQYVFQRFNPAGGVTFSPVHLFQLYVSYSESNRAPTSIELGCADPNNPCSLPNALAGDPPLDQVVTRTVEAGIRGSGEGKLRWSTGWFRGENYHDLLFVSSPQTGNGYFRNFGQTRREGLEGHLEGRVWRSNLGVNYTFLKATYQSSENISGSGNSTNDGGSPGMGGDIQIVPGNHIPLLPQHQWKAYADIQATKRLSIDVDLVAMSSSYARGNENNQHQPDEIYYLGPGTSPGYGVVNAGARYLLVKQVQLFVQMNNLLDLHYYTAAQLATTGFNNQGTFQARPFPPDANGNYAVVSATFYAPGAPFGAWGGMRFSF